MERTHKPDMEGAWMYADETQTRAGRAAAMALLVESTRSMEDEGRMLEAAWVAVRRTTQRVVGLAAATAAVVGLLVGLWIGRATSAPGPWCQEDEAWWWVAVDTRGCVPADDIAARLDWSSTAGR